MARLARAVIPGIPHHITQRGNRKQDTFFLDEDYAVYLDLMASWCRKHGVEIWAYCLMTNHVHLIAVPSDETGLARAIGEAHRRYTRHINAREDWTGYLWQGRFSSYPMDEAHLLAAARYVERNPVAAGMKRTARAYKWSSAKAHIDGVDDALVSVAPLLERVENWSAFLSGKDDPDAAKLIEAHSSTGRPLGDKAFIKTLEAKLSRTLAPQKRGRKPGSERAE